MGEGLMSALGQRRNLCSITEDPRWSELPIALVEEILSHDELPISSEAEVLALIAQWLGQRQHDKTDVARLLGSFRKCEHALVRVSDIDALMQALGMNILSCKEPRTGSGVWDPSFVVHRTEAAGPSQMGAASAETHATGEQDDCDNGEICHQLGPNVFLQQEPGSVRRCTSLPRFAYMHFVVTSRKTSSADSATQASGTSSGTAQPCPSV